MAIHHAAGFVEDSSALKGCQLIRFGDSPTFGLTCRLKDNPMWVSFNDEGNLPGPILFDAYGPCVAFGSEFVVGFDPKSIILNGDAATLGDLIIASDNLFLTRIGPSASRFGERVNVNLSTGEVVPHQRNSAVVRQWSISIDSWRNEQLAPVFERSP